MADDSIHMSVVQIGERKLRFLEWATTDDTISNSQEKKDNIPLFLGADVLSGCSIAVSNLPRMHAKFSKQSLAVKVNFPNSLRLHGIHGSARGVWFYSIQGLFRVCFEYYNREEQLECLTKLCASWKLRFTDKPFRQREIELSFQDTLKQQVEIPAGPDDADSTGQPYSDKNVNPSEITSTKITESDGNISHSPASGSFYHGCITTPNWKRYMKEIERISKEADHCDFEDLLDTIIRILKEYEVQTTPKNTGLSGVLVAVSKYLGDEFNRLQLEISERVTEFKKRHITSIDNLPPSSILVKELFPECMQVLLLSWMGSRDGGQDMNSIVQVILELVNMSLVSGVAHVLYSRLIQTDTV